MPGIEALCSHLESYGRVRTTEMQPVTLLQATLGGGLFLSSPRPHIFGMCSTQSVTFRNSRKAYGLAIVAFTGLFAAGLVVMIASRGAITGTLIGALAVGAGAVRIFQLARPFLDRTPSIEIYDYCVIDARFLKEWVLWKDVREISVTDTGAIHLVVEGEARYIGERRSLCSRLAERAGIFYGLPRIHIAATMLECTALDLLAAIRRASRPYGIPIRLVRTA